MSFSFRADQSLRRLAEALGIPACEIGGASVDGEAWSLELPVPDGSLVELFPRNEPLSLGARSGASLGAEPRFLADAHLGALARQLRLLGFDAEPRASARAGPEDEAFLETAIAEERILLTRDRSLLFRRELAREPPAVPSAMLILSRDPYGQLFEVCRRFGLSAMWKPLSLCSSCGAKLEPLSRQEAEPLVPSIVSRSCDSFRSCPACGKVFWRGDHSRSIEPLLERLGRDLEQA